MEVGIILSLYTTFGTLANLSLVFMAVYSVDALVSALFPVLKRDLFNSAPRVVNYKVGGKVPLISITGGITTLFFWVVIYEVVQNSAIAGAVTSTSIASMAAVAIVGAVIYVIARSYRKSHGVDLGLIFKEIPPE
jgi:hypothetical protein